MRFRISVRFPPDLPMSIQVRYVKELGPLQAFIKPVSARHGRTATYHMIESSSKKTIQIVFVARLSEQESLTNQLYLETKRQACTRIGRACRQFLFKVRPQCLSVIFRTWWFPRMLGGPDSLPKVLPSSLLFVHLSPCLSLFLSLSLSLSLYIYISPYIYIYTHRYLPVYLHLHIVRPNMSVYLSYLYQFILLYKPIDPDVSFLSVSISVYIYLSIYICIHLCLCLHLYLGFYISILMYLCLHPGLHLCIHMYVYV